MRGAGGLADLIRYELTELEQRARKHAHVGEFRVWYASKAFGLRAELESAAGAAAPAAPDGPFGDTGDEDFPRNRGDAAIE